MQKLKDEISEKKLQMRVLEQRMIGSVEMTPHTNTIEKSQVTVWHVIYIGFDVEADANECEIIQLKKTNKIQSVFVGEDVYRYRLYVFIWFYRLVGSY